jgi:hypothetical protein
MKRRLIVVALALAAVWLAVLALVPEDPHRHEPPCAAPTAATGC